MGWGGGTFLCKLYWYAPQTELVTVHVLLFSKMSKDLITLKLNMPWFGSLKGGGGHLAPGLKLGKGNDIFGVKMDKGVQRAELHTYPKNIEE